MRLRKSGLDGNKVDGGSIELKVCNGEDDDDDEVLGFLFRLFLGAKVEEEEGIVDFECFDCCLILRL